MKNPHVTGNQVEDPESTTMEVCAVFHCAAKGGYIHVRPVTRKDGTSVALPAKMDMYPLLAEARQRLNKNSFAPIFIAITNYNPLTGKAEGNVIDYRTQQPRFLLVPFPQAV